MSVIKVIKIGLPVATATSAAIATTSLVSFSKKDKLPTEEDLDKLIDDLKLPDEKYQDEKLFYSKDGTGKNQKVLDPETAEKLAKLLKEKGSLDDVGAPTPDAKPPINLDQEKSTDSGHKPSDVSSISGQEEKGSTPMSSDENDASEPKDKELQTQADLSDQIAKSKNDVSGEINDKGTENKFSNKESSSSEDEEQRDEPKSSLPEGLNGQDQSQDLSVNSAPDDEGSQTEGEPSSLRDNNDDNSGQNEAKKGLETDSIKNGGQSDDSELGAQVGQQAPKEMNDLSKMGSEKSGEAEGDLKGSEVNNDGRTSDGDNSLNEGTDPSGNRQNLTKEDIEKWSGVEAEISVVVGQLQNLINI